VTSSEFNHAEFTPTFRASFTLYIHESQIREKLPKQCLVYYAFFYPTQIIDNWEKSLTTRFCRDSNKKASLGFHVEKFQSWQKLRDKKLKKFTRYWLQKFRLKTGRIFKKFLWLIVKFSSEIKRMTLIEIWLSNSTQDFEWFLFKKKFIDWSWGWFNSFTYLKRDHILHFFALVHRDFLRKSGQIYNVSNFPGVGPRFTVWQVNKQPGRPGA